MDEKGYSIGGIGFLAILFILIFAVLGRGGFGGFGGWGNNCGNGWNDGCVGYGFQNYKATVDAEKAEIINTARTQYITEQQAGITREMIQATANATQAKIDYYGYQNERDKNAELARENSELRNKLFVKDQLEPITATLASIQCNMLRRPDVTGIGAVCPNAGIINGLGLTSLNHGCGTCGSNVLV